MKILLATDGSTHSEAAVAEVARRPWPQPSAIRVLSVIQRYTPPAAEFVLAGATLEDISRQQAAGAKEVTERAANALRDSGATVVHRNKENGDPSLRDRGRVGGIAVRRGCFPASRSPAEWSGDGKSLFYVVARDGGTNLWRQPIAGRP